MMRYFILVHPANASLNEIVRIDEEGVSVGGRTMEELAIEELMRLSKWDKGTIVIREATSNEVKDLDDLEAEQEAGEPDVGFHFPEDRNKIVNLLREWTNPLSYEEALAEIVENSYFACCGPDFAFRHLREKFGARILCERQLRAFLKILNFPAIREEKNNLKFARK